SASRTTSLGNSSASPDKALPNASRRESPLVPMSAGASAERVIQILLDIAAGHLERQQRLFGLFTRELHAAVPGRYVLHAGDALALGRVRDDDARTLARRTGAAERGQQGPDVVPVDFGDRPVERAPLCG